MLRRSCIAATGWRTHRCSPRLTFGELYHAWCVQLVVCDTLSCLGSIYGVSSWLSVTHCYVLESIHSASIWLFVTHSSFLESICNVSSWLFVTHYHV